MGRDKKSAGSPSSSHGWVALGVKDVLDMTPSGNERTQRKDTDRDSEEMKKRRSPAGNLSVTKVSPRFFPQP